MDNQTAIFALGAISSQWEELNCHNKYSIISDFDLSKDDFDRKLIPFNTAHHWQLLPSDVKSKLLSVGWLIYQQKTIQIETQVVAPACVDIINQQLPFTDHVAMKRAMAEALVDESYHTYLAINSCHSVQHHRQLPVLKFFDYKLTKSRQNLLNTMNSKWERRLASVAIACCFETLISDYLSLLSENPDIQPQLSQAVKVHAEDEMMHERVFFLLAEELSGHLSNDAKALFIRVVKLAESWFQDPEIEIWQQVLRQLNMPVLQPLIVELEHLPIADRIGIQRTPSLNHFIHSLTAS